MNEVLIKMLLNNKSLLFNRHFSNISLFNLCNLCTDPFKRLDFSLLLRLKTFFFIEIIKIPKT